MPPDASAPEDVQRSPAVDCMSCVAAGDMQTPLRCFELDDDKGDTLSIASTPQDASTLDRLQRLGIPCADTLHLAPGTKLRGVDGVELAVRIFYREHEQHKGHALVVAYDDALFSPSNAGEEKERDDDGSDDDDNDEENAYAVIGTGGTDEQAQSQVIKLMRLAPEREVVVRHSAANGRVGLMLRRMPPLLVTLQCAPGVPAIVAHATLAGGAPPIVPTSLLVDDEAELVASPPQQHLGETSGDELVRRAASAADKWAGWSGRLLWSLGKVYCCRDGRRPRYEALVEEQEEWTKVEWAADDGARILRVAVDAASALAQYEARPCTVRVALECVFGCAQAAPGAGQAGGSVALVAAEDHDSNGVFLQGDLRSAVVIAACVVPGADQ